jgi:phosphate starvation-inducible protein PhoH and related proteins
MSSGLTPTGTRTVNSVSPLDVRLEVRFDDNRLLPVLHGEHGSHLARLERLLDVSIAPRGNMLLLQGTEDAVGLARTALSTLWDRICRGEDIEGGDVDAAARMADQGFAAGAERGAAPVAALSVAGEAVIRTRRKVIVPRTAMQAEYVRALQRSRMVFGIGPAGTGKTYMAVAQGVALMAAGAVKRIILSRPAVEAGERLGFLPGDLREKVDPYLRPLYDALNDTMAPEQVVKRMESGEIEVAPLAFMRGRTLSDAFVILDEAQNTTAMQMKMFLTRLGEGSRMVITGDISQIDLPSNTPSGLKQAMSILHGVEGIDFVHFTHADVVRDELVARIVRAYDEQ